MKASKKRGFTIIELVIVIAVIAILAAVLIPTFANIIQKANVANDVALARNMNTILIADEATNGRSTDMYDVLIALEQGGFKLENLNPRADGNVFAWDKANNQIVYLEKGSAKPIFQAKEIGDNKGDLYITTRKAEVFADYPGYSYYFASDISGNITLDEGSCLDTGEFALNGDVSVKTNKDVEIQGTINGTITVDSASGKITNYSVVNNVVIVNTASTSYHERGHVGAMEIKDSLKGKVVLENDAYVEKLTNNKTNGTVESTGYVKAVEGKDTSVTATQSGYVLEIGTYDQLVNFRNKVNAGASYSGMTVKLTADIDISERAWTPIGAAYRDKIDANAKVFQGTFDGQGHKVTGLTNTGFKISSVYSGRNDTTPHEYKEYVFGLFGSVYNATIKNIVMANVNIDLACDEKEKVVGDSVGAIVGFAAGDETTGVTIENCKVLSGSIVGYDAVAGIIGRTYSAKTTINKCENAATVTAIRRAGGILGFTSGGKGTRVTAITNCKNSGNVKQTGTPTTDPAGEGGINYYMVAGLAICQKGNSPEIDITGSTNTGTVTLTVSAGGKNKSDTVWYY
uniref:prepilin-type N-terminal cleavage/methylation domain-containing protein n=1 Tax=Candidatus Fimenecus sp. TaxID=3022888 RepID=UPI004026485C